MSVALLSPTKRPPASLARTETACSSTLSITHGDRVAFSCSTPKCEIGCLARLRHDPHLRHDIFDTEDIANTRRRAIFYTRWHGFAEPLLQLWRG
ncbi:hypothetical protein ACFO0U_00490 [Chromohalobacter sarecensis]|uniref:Uncharacterized protein n=1 Tax=Chromohalobacter sarecensis TaxID=245294 RepID=A0ABV9CWD7_9GAMM|nr:hypothetical protein [Chromohalobacter sarecensis]MCK0715718.1 hypothetical protein [Chromohalobacter sarecensis]